MPQVEFKKKRRIVLPLSGGEDIAVLLVLQSCDSTITPHANDLTTSDISILTFDSESL